jgi:hypothetical protein
MRPLVRAGDRAERRERGTIRGSGISGFVLPPSLRRSHLPNSRIPSVLAWWLTPLYYLVVSTVLSSPKLFADDTTSPALDPGQGRTKTGYDRGHKMMSSSPYQILSSPASPLR